MKFSNLLTEINKKKGLFYSAALSLTLHLSFFIVNPVFSFVIFDKPEDLDGRFLTVEVINTEGKASERVEVSEVPKRSGKAGKGNIEKIVPTPEDNSIHGVSLENSGTLPASDDEDRAKPVAPATMDHTLDSDDRNVEVKETVAEEDSIEPETDLLSSLNSNSTEDEATIGDESESRDTLSAVPDQLSHIEAVQPTESPVGLEGEQLSEAVFIAKEDAAEQLFAAAPTKEDLIQTAVFEAIDQVKNEIEPEKKEGPIEGSRPRPLVPEQPAPITAVALVAKVEIKEEVSRENVVSDIVQKEANEDKEARVINEAQEAVVSSSANMAPQQLPKDESSRLNAEAIKPEAAKSVEQLADTDKKGEEKHETAKDESYVHEMPASAEKIEETKVAEKTDEPAKIVEQKIVPPVIKRKRVNPFHKLVEPGKEAAIGVPLGRPYIQITSPAKGKTGGRVQSVSGKAQGKGVTRVILSVNGGSTTVPVQDGRFIWDTALRDGKNTISGTVWDIDGHSASDTVVVEVLPPKNGFKITIDEPGGEIESPVAKVKGRVEDVAVETVRLMVNGDIVEAAVEGGFFEKTILFKERENTLAAEAVKSAGLAARTGPLTVTVKDPLVADILIHLVWNDTEVGPHPILLLKERSRLDDVRPARKEADMVELMSAMEGYGEKIFSIREADGAYALKAAGGKGTDCKLVVSLNPSKKVRIFEKRLMEGEEWLVGRFLMPEGVFWDEDEWFSGKIEGSDSVTKYKSPEGVTWKELK